LLRIFFAKIHQNNIHQTFFTKKILPLCINFLNMNRFVLILFAAALLHACSPHAGYVVRGELADADGWTVVLAKLTADTDFPVVIDSCVVKKGKFQMKGTVDFPEYCVLYFGDFGPLPLIVENTVIDIVVDFDNIHDSEVSGSKETDLFVEFSIKNVEFEEKVRTIQEEYMSSVLSGETDADKETEYVSQMEEIQQQVVAYMKQFAAEHPNNIFTALILDNMLAHYLEPDELEAFANGFDAVNSQSSWVQSIKEKAASAKRLATGQPFVDLKMSDPADNEIALSDYANKDKYLLIDFWASWCRPCRIGNPRKVELYRKYKDKGFEIVGVSFDRDKSEWLAAIEADALEWQQMSDLRFWQSEGAKQYMVTSIPYTVLLDKDGTILAKGLQIDDLDKKLAELIE